MRTFIGIVVFGAALSTVVMVLRRQRSSGSVGMPTVRLRDVPGVFAALSSTRKDRNFAVFLFGADGQTPAPMDALNVQFSIEAGRVGLDWVLLATLNLESQSRFVAFFERKARTVLRREANQVKYLRVEGEHLADLLQEFLSAEFKVTADQKINLIAEGFVWASYHAVAPDGAGAPAADGYIVRRTGERWFWR